MELQWHHTIKEAIKLPINSEEHNNVRNIRININYILNNLCNRIGC